MKAPALWCGSLVCLLAACDRPRPAREPAEVERAEEVVASGDPSRVRIGFETLGLHEAQRFNTQPTLSFPFFARSDRVLTAASLTLRFADLIAPVGGESDLRGLEISVNQEKVATLGPEQMRGFQREVHLPIDAAVIGDKNLLTLRLLTGREGPCGKIPPESWKIIRSGELEMQSAPLPLPDELSLLPLPFVDRHFDREASVAIVLPKAPTGRELQAVSRVAGWFGVDTGVPLRFVPQLGTLPDGPAVVLIDDPEQAKVLGLPAPAGASLLILDHPKFPRSNVKLLLVSGSTPEELDRAVDTLAAGSAGRFKGPLQLATAPVPRAAALADEAPRWLRGGHALRLAEVPGGEALIHDGVEGGKIASTFRLPPDVWVWPAEFVDLDLRWSLALPRDVPQPRLDVLFNGAYLGRLPDLDLPHGETRGEQHLRIHRDKLKGFNELVVFVNYADAERICTASAAGGGGARVQILPDTTFQLGAAGTFAPQPDIESFVNDGFPFTRFADLSQTGVVLSSPLDPAELGLLLSTLAHFASITGAPGMPAFLTAEQALEAGLDKDLLVLGTGETNPLLRRWADRLPLVLGGDAPRPQMPSQTDQLLALFTGRIGHQELRRARGLVAPLPRLSAAAGFESPSHAGRTVMVLAATRPEDLRSFSQFRGFAEGVVARGDLLVSSGNQRYRFAIGPSFGRGELSPWNTLRWFLAEHPLLLVPFLLVGVLLLAVVTRVSLERRVRERLESTEAL